MTNQQPIHPFTKRKPIINYDRVRELTEQHHTAEQIAAELGCSARAVYNIRYRLGINTNYNRPLTPERRALIEAAIADGWSQAEICRTYHVDAQTMRRHYPDAKWSTQQRAEHVRILRRTRTDHWGAVKQGARNG